MSKKVITSLFVLLLFRIITLAIYSIPEKETMNKELEKNYYSEESSTEKEWTNIPFPNCEFSHKEIPYEKTPCKETYSNICLACHDEKVNYYILGECE